MRLQILNFLSMNRHVVILTCFLFIITSAFGLSPDSLKYGSFGKMPVYVPYEAPKSVVLFVSSEDGWNRTASDIAKSIVLQGALVVGIDYKHYTRNLNSNSRKCYYPAADFEALSLLLQKKYKIRKYLKPILIGNGSGSTIIYGILSQAPGNTFKGAIALGFNPEFNSFKPLCNGTGLASQLIKGGKIFYLQPCKKLSAPFIILKGEKDKVFPITEIQKYIKDIPLCEMVSIPKVGYTFKVHRNWLPQFITAYNNVVDAPSFASQKNNNTLLASQPIIPLSGDMPINLIPSSSKDSLPLAFVISGDGGWTSFDQNLGEALSEKGISIVGLDAQSYFWNEKTPDETAAEISKAIEHFMQQWHKKSFILVGYSFGASIIPFVVNRLPADLKESLVGDYSLSPDEKADFEIHISDMLSIDNDDNNYDVLKEIKKMKLQNLVCVFGEEEESVATNNFIKTGIKVVVVPGSHHYNNDFNSVAELIIKHATQKGDSDVQ